MLGGELLANGAFGGIGRIGRAHRVAPFLDGVRRFQHHHHHRTFGHELHQRPVKRPLAVDAIEAFGFKLAEPLHLHSDDAESGLLNDGENLAGLVRGHASGLMIANVRSISLP